MSNVKNIIKAVWDNGDDKRYQPMSYTGGTGWGVWDTTVGRYIARSKELRGIDVNEPRSVYEAKHPLSKKTVH